MKKILISIIVFSAFFSCKEKQQVNLYEEEQKQKCLLFEESKKASEAEVEKIQTSLPEEVSESAIREAYTTLINNSITYAKPDTNLASLNGTYVTPGHYIEGFIACYYFEFISSVNGLILKNVKDPYLFTLRYRGSCTQDDEIVFDSKLSGLTVMDNVSYGWSEKDPDNPNNINPNRLFGKPVASTDNSANRKLLAYLTFLNNKIVK